MNPRWLPLVAGAILLSGCVVTTTPTGPTQYDSPSFERGDEKELHLNLNMGAGDLKVGTGTRRLVQAYFTYNVPSWKPEVSDSGPSGVRTITVRQPGEKHGHFGNTKYEWDLRLNQEVPLNLDVQFGAGKAQLDLGGLNLRSVSVQMGVGSLQMDLRGSPKHDYTVRIQGGVGEAVVQLPSNVGVYAEAHGGIGAVTVRNLIKMDGHWVNSLYGTNPVTVRITAEGGIGEIKLLGE